jgi:hypothetical protein
LSPQRSFVHTGAQAKSSTHSSPLAQHVRPPAQTWAAGQLAASGIGGLGASTGPASTPVLV